MNWRGSALTQRQRLVLLALVAFVVAAGGYTIWRWPAIWRTVSGPARNANHVVVSGNIEAHQSVLSFTQVQAPIVYLPFDEGAHVDGGALLARVDDRLYRRQADIDGRNLQLAVAQVAVDESNLVAAQNSVASDKFDLAEKQRDFVRADSAAKTGAASEQARDLALTAAKQSEAALARDQALVGVARDNITLANASQAAATERLKLDEVTLSYTELRAPFTGVISVREAELGQLASPGVAIFTLDDLDHPWLRAYVNEPDIGRVRLGEAVDVTTDSYPGKIYRGSISFISPQAEFTPKTVETHAERVTLVYRIRIDIHNPTHELLPGMPADAAIPLLASAK
jgi:HlyD family secretion protein